MRVLAAILMLVWALDADAEEAWPGSYPEGPAWIGGTLYWAEMYSDRIMAWDGGTPKVFLARPGCGPTAIARYREEALLVLCHLSGTLLVVDGGGVIAEEIRGATLDGAFQRLRNPNDASADGRGGVWFTDPGRFSKLAPAEGDLWHLAPDGTLTRHRRGLAYGNGVHVDRDGRRLLVSEHLARRVLVFDLLPDGLGAERVLFSLDTLGLPGSGYREAGPDGLEIGPDGTLWVAEYGAGRLLGWRQDGGLVAVVPVDAQFVTNIAFGPDGLAALTAPRDNSTPPFPGVTFVFEAERLTAATGSR